MPISNNYEDPFESRFLDKDKEEVQNKRKKATQPDDYNRDTYFTMKNSTSTVSEIFYSDHLIGE